MTSYLRVAPRPRLEDGSFSIVGRRRGGAPPSPCQCSATVKNLGPISLPLLLDQQYPSAYGTSCLPSAPPRWAPLPFPPCAPPPALSTTVHTRPPLPPLSAHAMGWGTCAAPANGSPIGRRRHCGGFHWDAAAAVAKVRPAVPPPPARAARPRPAVTARGGLRLCGSHQRGAARRDRTKR